MRTLSNLDTCERQVGFFIARLDFVIDCRPCSRNLSRLEKQIQMQWNETIILSVESFLVDI